MLRRALPRAAALTLALAGCADPAPAPGADSGIWPATYANVLFVNGAALVPGYGEPERDAAALRAVAAACPGMVVEGVDCSALIWQHGSLHCATMQIPAEILP